MAVKLNDGRQGEGGTLASVKRKYTICLLVWQGNFVREKLEPFHACVVPPGGIEPTSRP